MFMKRLSAIYLLFLVSFFGLSDTNAANFKIANGDIAAFKAALTIANANNQPDTIYLAYRGTYTFTVPVMDNTPFRAALVVQYDGLNPAANPLVIFGNGSIIERDLNAAEFRVITNMGGYLELNDLYIRNGREQLSGYGAGISNNSGNMLLNRCTLTNNSGAFWGGAVYGGYGYNKLVNCTITACSAAFGSAICFPDGNADVINCTITKNVCWGNTGKVAMLTATVTLDPNSHVVITNCIIADNKDGDGTYNDAGGALRSGGGNLIGAIKDVNTRYFTFNDDTGTSENPIDPQLGAFGYYGGGLVPTFPLASTASLAYGKANSMYAPALDQIGTNRVGAPSRGSMDLTPANFAFLKPNMQVLVNNSLIVDGSGQVVFPTTVSGQQSAVKNIVIRNNFNSVCLLRLQTNPAIILTGSGAEDFTIYADTIRAEFAPLAGHSETAFQIRFTPKSLGQKTAIVTIPSNDINHPTYQFTISGESVDVLPVALASFSGEPTAKGNLLKWQTLNEQDNDLFEVWRSNNQHPSKIIGKVNGSGTVTIAKSYQFLDKNPANGTNYYELKQIDHNSNAKTYGPIAIKSNLQLTDLKIYTTDKGVGVTLNILKAEEILFSIYNLNGKKLFSKTKFLDEGQNEVFMEHPLAKGVYLLQLNGKTLDRRTKFIR